MVRIKNVLIIFLILFATEVISQDYLYGYLVEFKDKANSEYSTDNPLEFLSQKAIDRRLKYGIEITEQDFPVNSSYIDSITNNTIELHTTSRWLNFAVFFTNNIDFIQQVSSISFVKSIKLVYRGRVSVKTGSNYNKWDNISSNSSLYGDSYSQISMCNADKLHNRGMYGQGIQIAVLDAGFSNMDNISGFDSLFYNNRILGTWDFVSHNANVFDDDSHGMSVLSILGGDVTGKLLGTAPKASYYLFRTENVVSEYPIEECNWVSAAEMADSLGVDIITSSLGYNVFDDKTMNYTYDDMNGKTTIITKGAEIAFAKGILVVASAGNEANKNWHYITAPSDGSNILCVGAVDKDRYIASFSSRGPSSDGRVKPDVLAQGVATTIIMSNGIVGSGSGTSYSGPVIAGMVACFWQAVPQYSNRQILDLIRSYSDRYENPDNIYGYGIPDFEKSAFLIDSSENKEIEQSGIDKLYPNPFTDKLQFHLMIDEAQNVTISLYDSKGVKVYDDTRFFSADTYNFIEITDLHTLQYGCYYLSVTTKESVFSNKVIKK